MTFNPEELWMLYEALDAFIRDCAEEDLLNAEILQFKVQKTLEKVAGDGYNGSPQAA